MGVLDELAARESGEEDFVRRTPTLTRVFKDVVNKERASDPYFWGPVLVVAPRDVVCVTTVNEEQVEGLVEVSRDELTMAHERDDRSFEFGLCDGALEEGQGVHAIVDRVNEGLVEVRPSALILFGSVVVVETEQDALTRLGGGAEVDARFATPRTDFEPRARGALAGHALRLVVERETFGAGHETAHGVGEVEQ